MIPLELRVRNFMCYRENVPPLDFEGIHLACLTGPNGHGKSALLDAMTWALWGKARAKHDDELIHQGQSEMEVEYSFGLGGAVYRVLRKRDSSRGGRSVLELQVRGEKGFRSIAEPTLRATQQALNHLLRMDYETFTNSSFLLQGKADTFTTRTPADRKQVLADILGLGLYDEYEQRAKERVRDTERRMAELDALLREADRELERQPEYESEFAQEQARVALLSDRVQNAEAVLRGLRAEQQAVEHQQARLKDLDRRLDQALHELGEIEAQISERQDRLTRYEQVMVQRASVEEGYAGLTAARQTVIAWDERLAQWARMQERQRELERVVEAARHEIELEEGRVGERIRDLEVRAAAAQRLLPELEGARARVSALNELQTQRDAARGRLQVLAELSAATRAQNDGLRTAMDALDDKDKLLRGETGQARCPLCGQPLSDEHRDELLGQFQAEGTTLADSYRANDASRRELAAEAARLEAEVARLGNELVSLPAQQRREAQLEQALGQAQEAASALPAAQSELARLDTRLESADYAPGERAELQRLAAELDVLGYDAEAHTRAKERVAAAQGFEEAYRQLQLAVEGVESERVGLADLRLRQERWSKSVAADREVRAQLAAEVDRLPELIEQVRSHALELEQIHSALSRARLALGAAQQKLDHCRTLAQERERHSANRQRLAEEKAVLDELRLAFGKKGIQAMIIEAAIPEIEFEANQLLSRMTEGRMHVRLETQRETQKGDTVETLDITIADELGTRSYDLFSGGEAFRVNLAIRIALSKLLARRAGARLELLVIDEGFGTQDAEGRERLVDAITSIQDDFARILVVTHIEELKDAFPVRIEVTKTADGSQISVN